jgi:hypothetical protein
VLPIFEAANPGDSSPREAIAAAWEFARGGERGKRLRDCAFAAMKAARDAKSPAAREAARAAVSAASSAYLHPLPNATQVKHILGSATYAASAAELAGVRFERPAATPAVIDVLKRYPPAPSGGGRAGEIMRELDRQLRDDPSP